MTASITVFVVEHDKTLRQAMSRLMRADGFRAECFESTDALPKKRDWPDGVVVLIVDLDTALRSDELFYKQLNIGDLHPPVICLTGCENCGFASRSGCAMRVLLLTLLLLPNLNPNSP